MKIVVSTSVNFQGVPDFRLHVHIATVFGIIHRNGVRDDEWRKPIRPLCAAGVGVPRFPRVA